MIMSLLDLTKLTDEAICITDVIVETREYNMRKKDSKLNNFRDSFIKSVRNDNQSTIAKHAVGLWIQLFNILNFVSWTELHDAIRSIYNLELMKYIKLEKSPLKPGNLVYYDDTLCVVEYQNYIYITKHTIRTNKLNISSNSIGTIKNNSFKRLDQIEELYIYNCELMSYESDAFGALVNLSELGFYCREIYKFVNMSNLVNLNIKVSTIETIIDFGHLPNLKKLDLCCMKTNVIDGFKGIENLETLDIYIDTIDKMYGFEGLPNLVEFYLYSTKIKQLDTFKCMSKLKKVNIDCNTIIDSNIYTFKHLTNLNNLILHSSNSILDTVFRLPQSLSKLDLQYDIMPSTSLIDRVSNIKELHLAYNRIKILDKDAFQGLSSLQVLDLSANEIEVISGFEGLVDIRRIDLHLNKIHTIAKDSFINLASLELLDVSNNDLSSLEAFENLTTVVKV